MANTARSVCPRCAEDTIMPVVWGMPTPDDFERAARGDFALGGCCVPDDVETATYWACVGCGHKFAVLPLGNDSPIGRLLEEISWEGNACAYRNGGGRRENVLTTEVFALLDVLPRTIFVGAVLAAAHGADDARTAAVADVEPMSVEVLPGDTQAALRDGSTSIWAVQPDVRLDSPRTTVWVEAKRIRSSSFQEHQIARTLQAMLSSAAQEVRILLLVLGAPPPVKVQHLGTVGIAESVAHSTAAMDNRDQEMLLTASRNALAWLTWDELATAVRRAADAYVTADPSTIAAVRRTTTAIERAIKWHS